MPLLNKRFDILVIGELNVDLILDGDINPEFNQKEKLLNDMNLVMGSSSAIFACGAARLGLKVAFIGKVGEDVFGHFMIDQLRSREVNVESVRVDPHVKTGATVILNKGNDRAILTYPGSIAELRKSDIDQKLFSEARHLHLGGYFLLSRLKKDIPDLFRLAHHNQMTTSLDTNYDPGEKWDLGGGQLLKETDIFLPNETELSAISGQTDVSQALNELAFIPTVTVKTGPEGSMAKQGDRVARARAMKVKVKDTVGAGDSFDAGFIYGVLAGFDLDKTLAFANICGSLSTRASGGIAGQPTLKEVLDKI